LRWIQASVPVFFWVQFAGMRMYPPRNGYRSGGYSGRSCAGVRKLLNGTSRLSPASHLSRPHPHMAARKAAAPANQIAIFNVSLFIEVTP